MAHPKKNILETKINDIQWLIEMREKPQTEKLAMIISKCPCCVGRVARTYWAHSDQELASELATAKNQIADQINIDDIYEK